MLEEYEESEEKSRKSDLDHEIDVIDPQNIPEEMRQFPNWVLWKAEISPGRDKPTKPPYQVTGKKAESNNPGTWCDFASVIKAYEAGGYDGIGFMITPETGLIGIDLDHVVNPITGKILVPWAEDIVNNLSSYTEYSPSGDGLHIWCKGVLPAQGGNDGVETIQAHMEAYAGGRYFTVTGRIFRDLNVIKEIGKPLQEAWDFMKSRKAKMNQSKETPKKESPHEQSSADFQWDGEVKHLPVKETTKELILSGAPKGQRSEAIMTVLNGLVWSGLTDKQIYEVFLQYPIGEKFREDRKGSQAWLLPQIEKARDHTTCRATSTLTKDDKPEHEHSQEEEEEEIIKNPESWPVLEPAAIYGSFLTYFIQMACAQSEADPAAILMTFLAWFAVELGNGPFMWEGDAKIFINILIAIIGNTSSGRKGTSAKPVKRLFRFSDPLYPPARCVPGPLSSGEGIIFAVRDPVEEWVIDKKTKVGSYVVTDRGETDKRLLILSEELAGAFNAMQRDGNILSVVIRQIYDSGNLSPLVKNNKNTATGAHIGIVGHITSFELLKLLKEKEIENGLINRFMLVCSRRQQVIPFPEPILDAVMNKMQRDLKSIINASHKIKQMKFSKASNDLWRIEYPKLSDDRGGVIGTIMARSASNVKRLSMLYALLDKSETIEPCHINAALAIMRYCEQSARFIFEAQAANDPIQKKILEALQPGPKTATEIYNHFQKHVTSKIIKDALKALMSQGKVFTITEKGRGRSKTIYSTEKPKTDTLMRTKCAPSTQNSLMI